jgi:hypothetical protein
MSDRRQNKIITCSLGNTRLHPQKTHEREALLKRHGEIQAELAQIERNIREIEARLPVEEQLSLKLRRFIEANIPCPGGQGSSGDTLSG